MTTIVLCISLPIHVTKKDKARATYQKKRSPDLVFQLRTNDIASYLQVIEFVLHALLNSTLNDFSKCN